MGSPNLNKAAAELVEAIRATKITQPDEIPPGWMTCADLSKSLGLGQSEVRRRLKLVPHETKVFRVMKENRAFPVLHYRLCKTRRT